MVGVAGLSCPVCRFLFRLSVRTVAITPSMIAAVAAVAKEGSTIIRYVAVNTVSFETVTQRGFAVFPSFHAAKEFVNPMPMLVAPKDSGICGWTRME